MKKSEAVRLIATILLDYSQHDAETQAEHVLNYMLGMGMMPPYSTGMRYKVGRSGDLYFSDDKEDGYQWEQE